MKRYLGKVIEEGEGTCNFCKKEGSGAVGSITGYLPKTEMQYERGYFFRDIGFKSIVTDWEAEEREVLICNECIRQLAQQIDNS